MAQPVVEDRNKHQVGWGNEIERLDFTLLKASWAMRKKVSFSVCTERLSDEAKGGMED